jgi:hypothetical protein
VCGDTLFNGEEIHKHHLEPRTQGGTDVLYRGVRMTGATTAAFYVDVVATSGQQ